MYKKAKPGSLSVKTTCSLLKKKNIEKDTSIEEKKEEKSVPYFCSSLMKITASYL